VPGTLGAKLLFAIAIAAAGAVAVAVRALDLSWQFEANGAMQLWLIGATALLLSAAASAVAIQAVRARKRIEMR